MNLHTRHVRPWRGAAIVSLTVLLVLFGPPPVAVAQDDPLLVGEYRVKQVIDGDTIVVDGLEKSIRFLCIDTEECEKGPGAEERSRRLADGFAAAARARVRENPIGQFNTPMGWEAKRFAERWFAIGSTVRIEYDSPSRKTGYYGRVLGYVFARVGERWVNYNVECVRAGMSAYFDKYGRSQRFEAAFLEAEREARMHGRGIWSPYAMAYPNYDERIAIWWRRGRALSQFAVRHAGDPAAAVVMDEDAWEKLASFTNKTVTLLSTVNAVNDRADPPLLELHHKEFDRLAVTFANREVHDAVRAFLADYPHDFITFQGTLAPGFEQERLRYRYRLVINDPGQVTVDLPAGDGPPRRPRKSVQLEGERIPWKDAARHLGRTVVVVGRIVRANDIGKLTFLNFARNYRGTLTLVIRQEHYPAFPAPPATAYRDHVVAARGKITDHNGAPQLVINGPDQIQILE